MEYIYGNPTKAHSWKNVASIFAAHDSLNSAQTSSLPLVQFWRASGKKYEGKQLNPDAQKLLEKCLGGTVTDEDTQLCFEYAVPVHSNSGSGKASMTDLMILTKTHTIAVEAKWTECDKPYQTITEWFKDRLGKGAKQENLDGVLKGWIQYINDYLDKKGLGKNAVEVNDGDYTTIPYQLLHRIASACAVAAGKKETGKKEKGKEGKEAAVIYQLFYSSDSDENMTMDNGWVNITLEKVKQFATNLQKGYEALFKIIKKPVPIRFCIIKTKVEPCKPIKALEHLCPVDTSKAGREKYDWNALFLEMQERPIYTFSDIELFPFDKK